MADFVIIGKENCPWCDKAKELIEEEGFTFAYFNIGGTEEDRLRIFLKSLNLATVPQIFVEGGAYVGGYDDLKNAFDHIRSAVNE